MSGGDSGLPVVREEPATTVMSEPKHPVGRSRTSQGQPYPTTTAAAAESSKNSPAVRRTLSASKEAPTPPKRIRHASAPQFSTDRPRSTINPALVSPFRDLFTPNSVQERQDLQGCNLRPSLLEEVLNEKKLGLLKSPEVIQFLQSQQYLQETKAQGTPPQGAWGAGMGGPSGGGGDNVMRGRGGSRDHDEASNSSVSESGSNESDVQNFGSIWSKEASAFSSVQSSKSKP